MADKVQFELVSPERLLLAEPVDMVVVPGEEGDFGVLPGHAPLISAVRPGVIEVWQGDTLSERIFVAGGFAEVTQERCTVLAEEAVRVADIDAAKARAALDKANTDLAQAAEADRPAAETRQRIAEARAAAA